MSGGLSEFLRVRQARRVPTAVEPTFTYALGHLTVKVRESQYPGLNQARTAMWAPFINPTGRRWVLHGQAQPTAMGLFISSQRVPVWGGKVSATSAFDELLTRARAHAGLLRALEGLDGRVFGAVLDDEGPAGPGYGRDVDLAVAASDDSYDDIEGLRHLEQCLQAMVEVAVGQEVFGDGRPLLNRLVGALNDRTSFFGTDFGAGHGGLVTTANVPEWPGAVARLWAAGPDLPANFCRLQLEAPVPPLAVRRRGALERLVRFLVVPRRAFSHPLLDRLRESVAGEVVFSEDEGQTCLRVGRLALADMVDAADLSLRFWHQLLKERLDDAGRSD